jgi:putative transposase
VSPQAKRSAVKYLVSARSYSERGACKVVGIGRSSARYLTKKSREEIKVRRSVRDLANRHPGYGYRRINVLLKRKGSQFNHKRIQRIWQAEGLQIPRRKPRKRVYGPQGEVIKKAQYRNHVWSYDFLEEQAQNGKRIRILVLIDEYTREFLSFQADRSFTSEKVINLLTWSFQIYGAPQHLRSDNGPEFTAKKVQKWLANQVCNTLYIHPGSPWENAYIESFNGKFRKECLNRYLLFTLQETRQIIEAWRDEYNHFRPHSSLDYMTPSAFAAEHSQIPLPDYQEHVKVY